MESEINVLCIFEFIAAIGMRHLHIMTGLLPAIMHRYAGMQITLLAGYCNEIRCINILYGDTNHISYAPTGFCEHKEVAFVGCSSQLSSKIKMEIMLNQYKIYMA